MSIEICRWPNQSERCVFDFYIQLKVTYIWDDKVPFLFKGYKRRPNAWILHPFEQRVFFSVPHHWDTGHAFIMVICEDPWHSHLMSSVWQWSCYYLFYRLRSVRAGIRKPNLPLAGRTLLSTVPPRRLFWSWCL